jgi:hypothetical protein
MRYLLLSSVFLLLAGCANEYRAMQPATGDPLCVEKFRPAFTSQLYKASVQVSGKNLSGLLLIKAMEDSTTRIVFSTETGIKFFDFSFGGALGFKVFYVMKQLDKKAVVNALRNDFELLLMRWVEAGNGSVASMGGQWYHGFTKGSKISYYITDSICSELHHAELASKRKKLVTANLYAMAGGVPDSMSIQHFNFNFNISLRKLHR